MSELVDFLNRMLDEDEATARTAADESAPDWQHGSEFGSCRVETVHKFGNAGYEYRVGITHDQEGLSDSVLPAAGDHIARHDPARVLAEVNARRAIVELHRPRYAVFYRESDRLLADALDSLTVPTVAHSGPHWPTPESEATLRLLASVWVDAPGFREEWR